MTTPGPWLLEEVPELGDVLGSRLIVRARHGKCVASVLPEPDGLTEEDYWNAQLIAAAPEMYAALKRIAGNHYGSADYARRQARAALTCTERTATERIRPATPADFGCDDRLTDQRLCEHPACNLVGPIVLMIQVGEAWYCPEHAA